MPMLHILSTHGLLLSFDLLNFQPSRVDICSPPQMLPDQSGMNMFRPIAIETRAAASAPSPVSGLQQQPQQSIAAPAIGAQPMFGNTTKLFSSPPDLQQTSNLTFSIPDTAATSTPAKPSLLTQPPLPQMQSTPKPNFPLGGTNTQPAKPAMANLFGATTTTSPAPIFGGGGGSLFNLGGSKEPNKPFSAATTPAAAAANLQSASVPGQLQTNAATKTSSEANQPFLTVQPNYKPSSQLTR